MNKKEVIYPLSDEIIGEASLKLDGEVDPNEYNNRIAEIINSLIGIDKNKLLFFIKNFGLNKILSDPSIMGVSETDEDALKNLRQILEQ